MRILFSLLLTLLTAAGTFFPCCMHDDCADEVAVSVTNHEEEKKDEACSPFFACGTCPAAVEVAKAPLIDVPETTVQPVHGAVYLVRLATFTADWFQPPRLG
ncbi:hypothetical protein [Paraflavitalea pollutisoli]|uniref:hypothetical protein n=1 Tax=Paraflavitalea pollutisoli TaxID=3034143 RepID=UPI0023EAD7BC|nr:hypothetical protein [Paraflavitalea sp. H1-2-19X]